MPRYYVSPEEKERRRQAQAAIRRAAKPQPFVPTPWSQGPHAKAAHDAGGKLIGVPFPNRHKWLAKLAAHAPGCSAPVNPYGPDAGEVPCGAKLNGETVFCDYCQPKSTVESIVNTLLESGPAWVAYEALPGRAKAALWQYMVEDGGVLDDEYESHVRKFRYKLQSYDPKKVVAAWDKMHQEDENFDFNAIPLHPHDEERVHVIQKLRDSGGEDWPYIVGIGQTFAQWASSTDNHGDGFHRAVASIRANRPVEFLFLNLKVKPNWEK